MVTGGSLISRRRVAVGLVWTAPVLVVATASPATAISGLLDVSLATAGIGANGYDLYLRDTKSTNSNTNTSTTTTTTLNLTLAVTWNGAPAAGAVVSVAGDQTFDGEGNYMIGFSLVSQTSGFGESSTQKTVSNVTTNASGQMVVKVSTATYGQVDCGSIPRSGTFTVTVAFNGQTISETYTYQVYDGAPIVNCP